MKDRVIVRTRKGKEFEAHYLIGADEPNSVVTHSLGLRKNKTLLGAIEAVVPVPLEVFFRFQDTPLFIFDETDMGHLWIFTRSEHLSGGIGALHPKPGGLQSTLHKVIEGYQIPPNGLTLQGHVVPIYTGKEKISTSRTMLMSDAAGLVDPLSGEGIHYAVQSGRLPLMPFFRIKSNGRRGSFTEKSVLAIESIGWWRKRYTATRPPVSSFSSVIHTPSKRSSTCTTKARLYPFAH
jgi:flavin-dependent dehydrogenase